ncbi:MAG: T9SS type A sorting domain-containing protein [Bacteroidota bacterium]
MDTATGVASWRFLSLDPTNLELTNDPFAGFLPPNVNSPKGEGFVSFTIRPRTGVSTGDTISNRASIIFDVNEPIITNKHLNIIDNLPPESTVTSLDAVQTDTLFNVNWAGTDNLSGIRTYDIFYAVNEREDFRLWLYDTERTEEVFVGQPDSTYQFYAIAKDFAGNRENEKTAAEASTLVTGTTFVEEDIFNPNQILVYPNPAREYVTITSNTLDLRNCQLQLYDGLGRNPKQRTIREDTFLLHIGDLASGYYILKFIFKDHILLKRLIVD